MDPSTMIAELEVHRSKIDAAIAALRGLNGVIEATAGPVPAPEPRPNMMGRGLPVSGPQAGRAKAVRSKFPLGRDRHHKADGEQLRSIPELAAEYLRGLPSREAKTTDIVAYVREHRPDLKPGSVESSVRGGLDRYTKYFRRRKALNGQSIVVMWSLKPGL
jgi:hypothetical protein